MQNINHSGKLPGISCSRIDQDIDGWANHVQSAVQYYIIMGGRL